MFDDVIPANRPKQIPPGHYRFEDFRIVKLGRKHYAFDGFGPPAQLDFGRTTRRPPLRVEFKCSRPTAIRRMQAAIVTARLTQ